MLNMFLKLMAVDAVMVLFCLVLGNMTWLINSQIGFFSSVLVMLASMQSYKQMVNRGVALGVSMDSGRDTLDIVEDPYELYDENKDNAEDKTLQEVVKEEREKLKKNKRGLWQTTKDTKASFSFYRLVAYAILVLGFFYLNNNNLLNIPSYLFALTLGMFAMVFTLNI